MTATHGSDGHSAEGPVYSLLNDQPAVDVEDDFLGAAQIAEGIVSLLAASRASSPFVLAIDAGWGMGKSTLLHRIETRLKEQPNVVTVSFNAWTAEGRTLSTG